MASREVDRIELRWAAISWITTTPRHARWTLKFFGERLGATKTAFRTAA
jgi:hypothetical protein